MNTISQRADIAGSLTTQTKNQSRTVVFNGPDAVTSYTLAPPDKGYDGIEVRCVNVGGGSRPTPSISVLDYYNSGPTPFTLGQYEVQVFQWVGALGRWSQAKGLAIV